MNASTTDCICGRLLENATLVVLGRIILLGGSTFIFLLTLWYAIKFIRHSI